jgi:RNA polymerase sigma-70 factor (ECF subfamily)
MKFDEQARDEDCKEMITDAMEDNRSGAMAPESSIQTREVGTRQENSDKHCEWRYLTSQLYDEIWIGLHIYLRGLGLLPLDAEDVAQETFFRLVRQLRAGAKIENIRAWVYHVAHNVSMDIHRSKRTSSLQEEANGFKVQEAADCRSNPEWLYLKREEVRRVRLAMSQLTPRQFRSVQLRANGLRYRDIAADLCVSEQRAIHLVKRALSRLSNSCS